MRLCKACVCSSTMDRNTSSERVTAFLPATDMWEITVLLQLTYLLYSFSSGPGCLLVFRERTRPFSSCWTACSLMECQCPRRARALMERSSRRALPPRPGRRASTEAPSRREAGDPRTRMSNQHVKEKSHSAATTAPSTGKRCSHQGEDVFPQGRS